MKKLLWVLIPFISLSAYADKRDIGLENKITSALQETTKSMKIVPDLADQDFRDESPRVPFATTKKCGGTNACTILVVNYDRSKGCEKNFERYGFINQGGGTARNTYNVKTNGICYEISTQKKQDAEKVANVLKSMK